MSSDNGFDAADASQDWVEAAYADDGQIVQADKASETPTFVVQSKVALSM